MSGGGPMCDHDLLIRVDQTVRDINRNLTNHLAHHWAVTLGLIGAVLTGLVALGMALWAR